MDIEEMINSYMKENYDLKNAERKVAQDIFLSKIFNSKFSNNITIKGGIVMHSISNNLRRVTKDIDLDFIRYSLEDDSIINFINSLNLINDGIIINIIYPIKNLRHQDYDGKRIDILFVDKHNNKIRTKLDIGVHKLFNINQDIYCFNLESINKHVSLLINSCEQIFVEKLKSLLKLGIRSTRYKDIFDFYYLINFTDMNKKRLLKCFNILIFNDDSIYEKNINDVLSRLKSIFNSKNYKDNLSNAKVNWLDLDTDLVINNILNYLENLQESFV